VVRSRMLRLSMVWIGGWGGAEVPLILKQTLLRGQLVKKKGQHTQSCPFLVGAAGFEPATSRTRTVRSTGLSHAPLLMSEVYHRRLHYERKHT
jgi:hypothetical protein